MPEALGHEDAALLYRSGELPPRERAEFEGHLAGCSPCREWLAGLEGASRLAGRALLRAPRPAAPVGGSSWGWPQRAQAAAAGAGVAMVSAVLLMSLARAPRQPLPASGALDEQLSAVAEELDRLDGELTRQQWDLEYEQGVDDLSRRRESLERQLAAPEGA